MTNDAKQKFDEIQKLPEGGSAADLETAKRIEKRRHEHKKQKESEFQKEYINGNMETPE